MGTLASGSIDLKAQQAASKTATNYITYIDATNGIRVYDGNSSNQNVNFAQLNANGMQVYKGGTAATNMVASFGENVQIGKSGATHTNIDSGGMRIYASNGTTLIANLGYGESYDATTQTSSTSPYYTFGSRNDSPGSAYSASKTYSRGDFVTYNGNSYVYTSTSSGSGHTPGSSSQFWSLIRGRNSFVAGQNNVASGGVSAAFGYGTHAIGNVSMAGGDSTSAFGIGSFSFGRVNSVQEDYSFAIGGECLVSGRYSGALGRMNTAAGAVSTVLGYNNIGNSDYGTVIGKCNEAATDKAFIIGNGDDSNTESGSTIDPDDPFRHNALTVDWSGNTVMTGNLTAVDGVFNGAVSGSSLSTTGALSAASGAFTGAVTASSIKVGGHSSAIGTIVEASQSDTTGPSITTTGMSNQTKGSSITLPAGVWVVSGQWQFQARASGTATNLEAGILNGSTIAARQRINVYGYSQVAIIQAVAVLNLSASATVYVYGASGVSISSKCPNEIHAVRIA